MRAVPSTKEHSYTSAQRDGIDRGLSEQGHALHAASISLNPRRPLLMIGRDATTCELQRRIAKVAPFDEPVLITGESGSGKELVARAIHALGARSAGPFQSVNCPQYQEGNLTVSELFGHQRGSFTGASSDREGVFDAAAGGVVFLDEIADLHMSAQVMLLRVLAEREFCRIGSHQPRPMNVRVVAATNRSLKGLMEREEFRNDLYFRLRYFTIHVPPLRARGDDWLLLSEHLLDSLAQRYGVRKQLSEECQRLLARYPWPGNARELGNVIASGYAMADSELIQPRDISEMLDAQQGSHRDSAIDALYRELLSSERSFWDLIYQPFIDRDLNRGEVRRVVSRGLAHCGGGYRDLVTLFKVGAENYQKFMDFLRHHRLKP